MVSINLKESGKCVIEGQNIHLELDDSEDMLDFGLSLIKNSFLSRIIQGRKQYANINMEQIIDEFIEEISDEISSDMHFAGDAESQLKQQRRKLLKCKRQVKTERANKKNLSVVHNLFDKKINKYFKYFI